MSGPGLGGSSPSSPSQKSPSIFQRLQRQGPLAGPGKASPHSAGTFKKFRLSQSIQESSVARDVAHLSFSTMAPYCISLIVRGSFNYLSPSSATGILTGIARAAHFHPLPSGHLALTRYFLARTALCDTRPLFSAVSSLLASCAI